MGGRSLAYVPRPRRLFARRRGGSFGSGWAVLFFPGVLIEFVGFKGRALHQIAWRALVQIGLDPLTQRMHLFAGQLEFAGQARSRFAFGDAAQQQYQCSGRLAGFLERGIGQQGIVAITVAAAIGRKVFLLTEEPASRTPAMRTDEALGMQVALQPDHANARIEQLGDRKVYHTAMIPHRTLITHEP
jgi:hypothetical protein